jgi:hypothetical protein
MFNEENSKGSNWMRVEKRNEHEKGMVKKTTV